MNKLFRKFLIVGLVVASLSGLWFAPQALARRRSRNSRDNAIVNNFSFKTMNVTYRLSKDSNGRSVMKVHEKLVANFPNYNQNHGIERAIPKFYDGHKVFYGEITVKRNGLPENINSVLSENDNAVFRIGDENAFIHGEQRYEIEYTLRDVIKDSGEYQELYWNVNGNQWRQRFENVQAEIIFDESISDIYDGQIACFSGIYGSVSSCHEKHVVDDSGTKFFFRETAVYPRSGLTFAIKIKKGSFKPYEMTFVETVADFASTGASFLGVVLLFISFGLLPVYGRSKKSKNAIIPQYLPPKGLDLYRSAIILNKKVKISALIMDLAINNKIKIIESKKKGVIGEKKEYSLELVTTDGVTGLQKEMMNIFFKGGRKVFPVKNLSTEGGGLAMVQHSMYHNFRKNKNYYLSRDSLNRLTLMSVLAILSAASTFFIRMIFDIAPITNPLIITMAATSFVGGIAVVIIISLIAPLNDRGAEKKAYLEGLKMYIKLAESERLKFLQSVDGAERIDVSDNIAKVKLYEKLLPYAMMFGLEKSWMKVLEKEMGDMYKPDWYTGGDFVNAIAISSVISGFSSSVNSYSASSGGGSGFGGGGFSGGGGGGGGGGGW